MEEHICAENTIGERGSGNKAQMTIYTYWHEEESNLEVTRVGCGRACRCKIVKSLDGQLMSNSILA